MNMAEDEQTGIDDNMLALDDEKSQW